MFERKLKEWQSTNVEQMRISVTKHENSDYLKSGEYVMLHQHRWNSPKSTEGTIVVHKVALPNLINRLSTFYR